MRIHTSKLIHMPVFTESGMKLGQISDIEIDVGTHAVAHYVVGHRFIGKDTSLVSPVQVKSITLEKMVVDDIFGTETEKEKDTPASQRTALGGVSPFETL